MSVSTLSTVLFITVCAFCTLYIPQPILPLLAEQYGVSLTDSALLISATLVPLGIAPLVYGYITEATSAQRVLLVSLAALALNQGLFLLVDSYWGLVSLRFMQGLLLPAIFTALMTYFASMASVGRVRNAVSYYIAATILGGFFCSAGRADEWEEFVKSHADKITGHDKDLAQVTESIRLCAALRDAQSGATNAWFAASSVGGASGQSRLARNARQQPFPAATAQAPSSPLASDDESVRVVRVLAPLDLERQARALGAAGVAAHHGPRAEALADLVEGAVQATAPLGLLRRSE